jgi:transcriptional regulator with AAA-type ATPase domain
MDAPETLKHYRLRGEVDGAQRTFLLARGRNEVGSLVLNQVVLPERGVSRHHAAILIEGSGLVVEDLGSKNGTFVNDERVTRSALRAGDRVAFGQVVLEVEEVDEDDTVLAVAFHLAPQALSEGEDGETTWVPHAVPGPLEESGLRLVERFVDRACTRGEGSLAAALGVVVRELCVQGAGLVEWSGAGEPVALAGWGDTEELSVNSAAREAFSRAAAAGRTRQVCEATLLEGRVPLSLAVIAGSGTDPLGLVILGDYPGRSHSDTLLRTLVRISDRIRPSPVAVEGHPEVPQVPELVFPAGYVPSEAPAMVALYRQMRPLVQSDLPVLVTGETGVGKEFLARTLHASSPRRSGPFVAFNCAAIPAELMEAEMFGIGKGVATGVLERQGKFHLAQGGTLLLDEIGDMSVDLQAKLLRALQEREVHPVGGSYPIPVDVRVVAASNMDLLERMEQGAFRRDLYYRLAGYVLRVPPLRDRTPDIPVLVEHFIRSFAHEAGKWVRGITIRALRLLADHPWPGNIRELEYTIRRLVYLCPHGQAIEASLVAEQLPSVPAEFVAPGDGGPSASDSLTLAAHLDELERRLIREALGRTQGNRTLAAKLLGVSRNGLALKMERLGIEP